MILSPRDRLTLAARFYPGEWAPGLNGVSTMDTIVLTNARTGQRCQHVCKPGAEPVPVADWQYGCWLEDCETRQRAGGCAGCFKSRVDRVGINRRSGRWCIVRTARPAPTREAIARALTPLFRARLLPERRGIRHAIVIDRDGEPVNGGYLYTVSIVTRGHAWLDGRRYALEV